MQKKKCIWLHNYDFIDLSSCLLLTDYCIETLFMRYAYELWTIIQSFQINWVSECSGVMSAHTWICVWWLCMCVCVCLVAAHDGTDPAVVAAHTGVDTWVSLHSAVITPGNHSLQLTITHQRTTGVSLQTQTESGQQWSESVCGVLLSWQWAQSLKNNIW